MEERNNLISSLEQENDDEISLRPQYLKEYVGQKDLKENLDIFIKAAKILSLIHI